MLGDAEAVEARLRDHPELATQPGGPQDWEPLLYVCHTCMHLAEPARVAGLVTIARRLCALGANPNAEYHWNWHPELPRTALWGAICAVGHLPLANVLLEAGANPTDGVSVHIAGGGGNLDALELLHRYGVNVNGIPGGVPPLVYMMTWAENPAGPYWLLEHGADPNLAWGMDGEAPLHVAARRWDVAMVEAARTARRRCVAAPRRRQDAAHAGRAVRQRRHRGVAARARREERALARSIASSLPARAAIARPPKPCWRRVRHSEWSCGPEHHVMLHRPAESGNAAVLETMLACGFETDAKDKDNVTPLHRAAMGGHADAVRVLLKYGADVNAIDGMFSATPLVWAVEGRGNATAPGADHVEVARVLIAAGSPLEWTPPEGAPGPERTLEGLVELKRLAQQMR